MWIEERIEARHSVPDYQARSFDADERERGAHRMFVGGNWEEIGQLQRDFLLGQGLTPQMRFIDVGCGSLRAGRQLIPVLDPGHYYGIDINAELPEAGYDLELDDEARARLPRENLRATDRFDADFGVQFDMGIAQSVFTHVSLNHVRLCLHRVAQVLAPGGRFYATFFERPDSFPLDKIEHRFYTERNMFWYYRRDMRYAARGLPLEFRYIGDWQHPVKQKMVEYTRLPD